MPVIKLSDEIKTGYSGYKKLIQFYSECREFTNETISIDFYDLMWIDANLCALFEAILYKLGSENKLVFSYDDVFVRSKFDVLFRNGFLKTGEIIEDIQKSTMPAQFFTWDNKDDFLKYIEEKLFGHRGMPKLTQDLSEKISDDLIEIFCNSNHHANTKHPFFVAGQYYPNQKLLRFTMVDLGDGFLPRIKAATNGAIENDLMAIQWAIAGNSSKIILDKTPGALGIKSILRYCEENGGELDIISGNGYWSSTYANTIFKEGRELEIKFVGTTINLTFQH